MKGKLREVGFNELLDACWNLNVRLPICRAALHMKAGKESDRLVSDEIKERIGKLAQQRTMNVTMHYLISIWITLDTR
jgi:hypothetical protein